MKFCITWYQPTEDFKPIETILDGAVIWENWGLFCVKEVWLMKAKVEAKDKETALLIIKKYWPEAKDITLNGY